MEPWAKNRDLSANKSMAVLLSIVQLIAAPYAMFSSGFTFIYRTFLERTKTKLIACWLSKRVQIRSSDLFLNAVFG